MAANPALTQHASRRRDDPAATGLLPRARNGDRQAWEAVQTGTPPLIWSICRSRRMDAADAQDAAPERLAQAHGSAGEYPRPGRASRLAGHHPARMPPHPAHCPDASQLHGHSERKASSEPCYAFLADPAIQGGGFVITVRTRRIP
jgi:hypothetical protein